MPVLCMGGSQSYRRGAQQAAFVCSNTYGIYDLGCGSCVSKILHVP